MSSSVAVRRPRRRLPRERDWLLLLVSFWHGLRASEAINLTPENFADGFLTVQRLKGSMRTVQPLVEDENELLNEKKALESWISRHEAAARAPKVRNGLPSVLPGSNFYRLVRRYGQQAGLPKHLCHPHVLKHSIAMQSIREAGIENVRQYLGHRSISSTGEYLKVSDAAASSATAAAAKPRKHNS